MQLNKAQQVEERYKEQNVGITSAQRDLQQANLHTY